jgi:DNA-binding CsgD family transcriptional regulator
LVWFYGIVPSEDAEELVQDGTLIAAQRIHNAEQAGKKVVRNLGAGRRSARKVRTISAGNIACYTIQKLKCGRRSTGSSTVDVYGSGTQINGKSRLESMEQVVGSNEENGGEIYLLHNVLADNQHDLGTEAAKRMDWSDFMAGLSKREQVIIHCIIEGKPLGSLARKRHLNTSTILYPINSPANSATEFVSLALLHAGQIRDRR